MSTLPDTQHSHHLPSKAELALHWRMLRDAYRYANLASHHLLGFTVKLVMIVYFVLALVFLTLRYAILPNIDYYKPNIEKLASSAIGLTVKIERVYASWSGLRPNLILGDVVINDKSGRTALRLPSVSATLSWWTLFSAKLRFSRLELGRPDLDIRRDVDGKLYVAGLFIDPHRGGDGKSAEWLLSQREVLIHQGRLRWTDLQRAAPELVLEDVNLTMHNQWRRHRAGLTATPPASFGGPIDIRTDFEHRAFASRIADVRQWTGVLFADVRETDLAIWKAYFNYPFEVQQGQGSLRLWLDLDRAKLANFTADLRLSHVQARLRPDLQALHLRSVSGRISAREDLPKKTLKELAEKISTDTAEEVREPSFGRDGHQVSLQNFSLETDDGLHLAAISIEESFQAATKKTPEKTRLQASALDLRTLSELATRLPLSAPQRQMLHDFSPSGAVRNFSIEWDGSYPEVTSYHVKGNFIGLGLAAQLGKAATPKQGNQPAQAAVPAIPGFQNLTGSIEANEQGGKFDLASHNFSVQLPRYLEEPHLQLSELSMQASWDLREKEQVVFAVKSMNFELDGIKGKMSGKHWLPLTPGKGLGRVDLKAEIDDFAVHRIKRFIPQQASKDLRAWLGYALEAGNAQQVSVKIAGELDHFPYATPATVKLGEFLVRGQLDDVKLNYSPGSFAKDGVSPEWPLAEAINGYFMLDRGRLEIFADNAKTRGLALNHVKAIIPDLLEDNAHLEIDGSATGSLQNFVNYVNHSPVAQWIGHFTEHTKAEGQAKLALKFRMPLNHAIDTKVKGSLQLLSNDIVLLKDLPKLTGTNGRIEFTEHGVNLPNMHSNFLGGPLVLTGGSQADGNILIRASGSASVEGIRRSFQSAGIQTISHQFQGGARYIASIAVKKRQTEINVESNLQGLAMNLPAPLQKAAGDALNLRVSQASVHSEDGLRDEIKVSLGNTLFAKYQRQKSDEVGSVWRVVRGGIGVNVSAPEPESGVTVHANMHSVNLDAWRTLAQTINRAGASGHAQERTELDSAENAVAQYLDPDVLAARADELVMLGKKVDDVVVGASHQKGIWQANIASKQVAGHITWNDGHASGTGKVTARLSSLIIPESAAADVTDLLEGKASDTQIPALDVVAENFELFNKKLGHLELQANNQRIAGQREWRINKLSLESPDAVLQATGKWVNRDAQGLTNLNFNLDMKNAGKMLERFGFVHVLRGGQGRLHGEINWQGMPFSLDLPSLSGQMKLEMAAGQFLKVEPGAAKLLSVLSLQALPKLLKLDFNDVFSEGFAFDGIIANAQINKGVLHTKDLKMRSVNATVTMDGTADIASETQNLYVVVSPEINVGTASVVYALAVNPVIGLGSYLAQLFLRDPLSRALSFQYQVTGSWKAPTIAKVEARALPAPQKM